MESTQDMEYAASGMEIEALFALDPTPLQGLDYGQYTIDMIEQYKALGFQAQRIGIGTENFYCLFNSQPGSPLLFDCAVSARRQYGRGAVSRSVCI